MTTAVWVVVLAYPALSPRADRLHAEAQTLADQVAVGLTGSGMSVRGTAVVDAPDAADRAATLIATAHPQAVVLVPATAAPPAWSVRSVPPGIPVVVWDVSRGERLPDTMDQHRAHADTSAIGAIMAGGALALVGYRFRAVSAPRDQVEPIRALLATLAGQPGRPSIWADEMPEVRHERPAVSGEEPSTLRVLRIGAPIDGYSTMQLDEQTRQWTGLEVVDGELSTVDGPPADASPEQRSEWLVQRIGVLAEREGVNAVAVNCHGPWFRDHPGIGVTACLAASGTVPTSCTADVPTAWLLAELARHGHEALYCEPYTVDDDRDAVFLGNCGIGAAGLARAGSWTTLPSQYYPGRHGRGTSVAMAVRPGPATYLAARPGGDGWRVVAIEGTVLPDMVDGFGGAQAFFRPATRTPRAMVTMLAELGVVHHGALIQGLPRQGMALHIWRSVESG